jgi:hypothetical protein
MKTLKKIFLFLLTLPFTLFSQSIYPLPFTFDDSNLYVLSISIQNFNTINNSRIQMFGAILIDANNNMFSFNKKLENFPNCPEIQTLNELHNYKNIFKNEPIYCHNFIDSFYQKQEWKEINLKNGIKILTEDSINDMGKYNSYEARAIITYKDKILGTMGYISPYHDKSKFLSLLKTVEFNKNIKSIDEYIDEIKKNIDRYFINQALKNAISVLLLDINNKEIKLLLEKIYTKQKELINANEKDLKNINNDTKS